MMPTYNNTVVDNMQLYSIGQVSAMIDVPVKTIRYYESVGLIAPSQTDEVSSYRYYSIDDIFRLDLIRCLGRQLGMPLKTIREYLNESDRTDEKMKVYLRNQEQDIDDQIHELMLRKDFISRKLEAIGAREEKPLMQPKVVHFPRRELSVCREMVNSIEDAILKTRKMATLYDTGNDHELFLIRDVFQDNFDDFSSLQVIMGISGNHAADGLSLYTLEEGDYVEIHYLNQREKRREAMGLVCRYAAENSLSRIGPMIVSGSIIDATSATSWNYCLTTIFMVK